jgi:hypothetical protein
MRYKSRRTRVCHVVRQHGSAGLREAHPTFDSI